MADPMMDMGGGNNDGLMGHATSQIELHMRGHNLKDMDSFSKSDPQVVVFMKENGAWGEVGRSEVIDDNLNPEWVTSVTVPYYFETTQPLKFLVVDIDDPKGRLDQQDVIGEATTDLASIVTSRGQSVRLRLAYSQAPGARGDLTVSAEEVQQLNYTVTMQFAGKKLDKKDFFGKSDPFLVISRSREDGSWVPTCKTEVIKSNLNPTWRPFTTSVQRVCNGDFDRPLLVSVSDWNRSGSHDYIGEFTTSMRELAGGEVREWELINPEKKRKKKKKYKNSGTIRMVNVKLVKQHSFVDYLRGGAELGLTVAIDFTASNGNPSYTNSLHYSNPYQPNEYVQAISSVCNILCRYDSDQRYPVYGFGARLPPNNQVSHCFPCNFDYQNPEVEGLDGILAAYQNALNNVTLYGPTCMATLVDTAAEIASQHVDQENQAYHILLIITDGVLNDMDATCSSIVAASSLPLSIVIVGVGSADFGNMEILDGDDEALRSREGVAQRDIVQFVEFRAATTPAKLAAEVLAEIPTQMLGYFKSKGIVPNEPPPNPYANDVVPSPTAAAPAPAPVVAPTGVQPGGPSGAQPGGPPPYTG